MDLHRPISRLDIIGFSDTKTDFGSKYWEYNCFFLVCENMTKHILFTVQLCGASSIIICH